jgi:hypothetical protein
MNQSKPASNFEKWKFAGSLPAMLVLPCDYPPIPCGALAAEFDTFKVEPDRRILMKQVWYTTPKRIHGLLHYDGPTQLFFVGYECGECAEVFLVPDTVENETGLVKTLRHKCTEADAMRSTP